MVCTVQTRLTAELLDYFKRVFIGIREKNGPES